MLQNEKLVNAILMIAGSTKVENLGTGKLNSMLFYTDLCHLRTFNHQITGARYLKSVYGPLVNNLRSLLSQMASEGLITLETKYLDEGHRYKMTCVKAIAPAKTEVFSENERDSINAVINRMGVWTSREIAEVSKNERIVTQARKFGFLNFEDVGQFKIKAFA